MSKSDQIENPGPPKYEDLCPEHKRIVDIYVERFREYFNDAPKAALIFAAMAFSIVLQDRENELMEQE